MKRLPVAMAVAIAACGSTTPPKKMMTCDAGLCGGLCCPLDQECVTNGAGDQVCATPCSLPTDCTDTAEPCCMPVLVGGNYGGKAICAANPSSATAYTCTCGPNTGCGSNSQECAPLIGDTSGFISGPYVCLPNDGQNHHGCALPPSTCSVSGQYCATDNAQDRFCSPGCTMDSDCMMCCGLCGH
jgi:hypothetical protein